MEEGKTCTKCGEWKLFNEFQKRKEMKDGYRNECLKCRSGYNKKLREKNKDSYKEKSKQYYYKNKEKYLQQSKEWAKANPIKMKEAKKRYEQKNKEKIKAYKAEYHEKNKEKYLQQWREYKLKNKDKILANLDREKERKRTIKYYYENKEKISAKRKKYYHENYDKFYQRQVKRRSLKYKVSFKPYGRKYILERDKWTCQNCNIKVHDRRSGDWNTPDKAHIDHIIPISKGGDSEPNNLQVLCRTCNLSKRDKVELQLSLL